MVTDEDRAELHCDWLSAGHGPHLPTSAQVRAQNRDQESFYGVQEHRKAVGHIPYLRGTEEASLSTPSEGMRGEEEEDGEQSTLQKGGSCRDTLHSSTPGNTWFRLQSGA